MAIPKRDLSELVATLRRSRLLVTPEEVEHRLPATFPTGIEALDRLLGGGLPQGKIVECAGRGPGSTAVALSVAAKGTGVGRLVAWVDRADAFDPRAAQGAGVELGRLLWCRPREDRDAIRAADALLASGAFPLVILDLRAEGIQPKGGRRLVAQGAWLRLAREAEARRSTLLVLGEAGAQTFSAVRLSSAGSQALFHGEGPGRTFEGLRITFRLERNKLGLPPGEAPSTFHVPVAPTLPLDPAPGHVRLREGR